MKLEIAHIIYKRVTETGTRNPRLRVKRELKRHEIRNRKLSEIHAQIRKEVDARASAIEDAWNPNNQLQNMVDWSVSKRAVKPELNAGDFPPGYFDSLSGKGGVTLPGDDEN